MHQSRRLVKHFVHEPKPELEQDLLRIQMFGMMAGSQRPELQFIEPMLHYSVSYLEGISASPFRLQEMKSQLMAFRGRVCPGSQSQQPANSSVCFSKMGQY